MRLCLLFAYSCLLSSCMSSPRIPRIDASGVEIVSSEASSPFEHIAYWGSGLAGLGFLIGIILLWIKPKLGQQVLVTAVSVLIGSQIMLWVGAHLAFLSIITLILGLAYVSYKHKEEIIDIFDGETTAIEKKES
jgi:hypothetical protein